MEGAGCTVLQPSHSPTGTKAKEVGDDDSLWMNQSNG